MKTGWRFLDCRHLYNDLFKRKLRTVHTNVFRAIVPDHVPNFHSEQGISSRKDDAADRSLGYVIIFVYDQYSLCLQNCKLCVSRVILATSS